MLDLLMSGEACPKRPSSYPRGSVMVATQNPTNSDGGDGALDRLEAALNAIERGVRARPAEVPPVPVAADADLQQVEERLDAAIDFVKSALGRKTEV